MPLFEQSSFINPIHLENEIKIRSTGFSVGQFILTFLVAFLYHKERSTVIQFLLSIT